MFCLRPIRENDLPGLVALARSIDGSLTTLPPNEDFLRDRIENARLAFRAGIRKPQGEFYLFVLEDTATGNLVGTSGLASRVGGFDPFYSYEIRQERFTHAPLGIAKDLAVLHLKQEHSGPSEICSLFLRADSRRSGAGRLLSFGRFLFMAAFRERFDATVIAELRGYTDQQGRSPFWEAVGRHFFEHDFYAADNRSGLGNKQFIADLIPRHPLYAALLPPAVQAIIGRVHHDTEPALAMLRQEGFQATNEVDIFDAGPQLRAATAEVRTIKAARRSVVEAIVPELAAGAPRLLANGALDFRACLGLITETGAGVVLAQAAAAVLQVKPGDAVWHVPLKP